MKKKQKLMDETYLFKYTDSYGEVIYIKGFGELLINDVKYPFYIYKDVLDKCKIYCWQSFDIFFICSSDVLDHALHSIPICFYDTVNYVLKEDGNLDSMKVAGKDNDKIKNKVAKLDKSKLDKKSFELSFKDEDVEFSAKCKFWWKEDK